MIKVVFRNLPRMEYLTPEEMREAEVRAASLGLDEAALMENAGAAVARVLNDRYSRAGGRRILVVCGLGNNGGDGMVAARHLAEGWQVRVLLLGSAATIKTRISAENWERLGPQVEKAEAADATALAGRSEWFDWANIILDSILGTGVKGEVREPMASAIRLMNASVAVTVAVDVPSGLDPLTGGASASTVQADLTIALHRAKVGLRGKQEYTGEIVVVPIGMMG